MGGISRGAGCCATPALRGGGGAADCILALTVGVWGGGAVAGGGAPAEAAEEKTDFDVVLEAVDDSKRVASLKIVRTITGLGLKETKDFMSALPKAVNTCD